MWGPRSGLGPWGKAMWAETSSAQGQLTARVIRAGQRGDSLSTGQSTPITGLPDHCSPDPNLGSEGTLGMKPGERWPGQEA